MRSFKNVYNSDGTVDQLDVYCRDSNAYKILKRNVESRTSGIGNLCAISNLHNIKRFAFVARGCKALSLHLVESSVADRQINSCSTLSASHIKYTEGPNQI